MAVDGSVCVTGDLTANHGPIAVYSTISYRNVNPYSQPIHPIHLPHLVNPDSLSILNSRLP